LASFNFAPLTSIPRYNFKSSTSCIPHPSKVAKGGEDAHFISDDSTAVGIADGVGGWTDLGIDPSLFSRSLMQNAKEAVDLQQIRDPLEILTQAYENTKHITGSCTASIAVLDGEELQTINLGDSGFMILRNARIIYRSKEQQYSFNFPFQLGTGSNEQPSDGVLMKMTVEEGDMIVMGTDGLFDNLHDDEIMKIIQENEEIKNSPNKLAHLLAVKAHEAACSADRDTPFAINARKNNIPFYGGKLDDITVTVCIVDPINREKSSQQPDEEQLN